MHILIAEDDPVSALVLRKTLEKAVREHGGDIYVFVILLTAKTQKDDRLTALAAGVDDFLAKPLDRAELSARLSVAERLITWQRTLQEVNASLLMSSQVLAEQAAELDRMHQEAEYLANHDHLTGVINRRRWFEIAAQERPTGVAIFDLDHFKNVNDTHGHPAGDAILVECANRLTVSVDRAGSVGRLGGEEFAVLFTCGWNEAQEIAQRVVDDIAAAPFTLPDGQPLDITVSGGLSPWLPDAGSREASIARTYDAADAALYDAKTGGRNRLMLSKLRAA